MRVNGSQRGEVNYTIPFSSGCLTPKHIKRIGPAWALFLHYEDRVTTGRGTNGFVLGGKETTDEEPAKRFGCDLTTIGRHRRRLEKYGYISTELTRKGYKVTVRKSKKWLQMRAWEGKIALRQGRFALRQGKTGRPGASVPINDLALTLQGHLPAEWESFWKAYPKKKSIGDAEKAWKKIKIADVPAIMAAIEAQRNTHAWTKEKRRYCPYPASFLNKRQWKDESPEVSNTGERCGTSSFSRNKGGAGRTAGPHKPEALSRPIPAGRNALAEPRGG